MSVICIVLTGGPCGGKSSSLMALKIALEDSGYRVMTMPEVPTILMSNGAQFPGINGPKDLLIEYESLLIKLQLYMEDNFRGFLNLDIETRSLPGILICDRVNIDNCRFPISISLSINSASPDSAAYIPDDIWESLLFKLDRSHEELMSRYDIVCHLNTAANGAEEHYSLENNSVRTETAAEARIQDLRTLNAWIGHPCHRIFENIPSEGFAGKLNAVIAHIFDELEVRKKERSQ